MAFAVESCLNRSLKMCPAGRPGLEPGTSAFKARRSSQLSYRPKQESRTRTCDGGFRGHCCWRATLPKSTWADSNRRHDALQASASPLGHTYIAIPQGQYRPRDSNSHPFGLDSESSASTSSTRPVQCQWRESNSPTGKKEAARFERAGDAAGWIRTTEVPRDNCSTGSRNRPDSATAANTPGAIRTHNILVLSQTPLPVGLQGLNY